MAEANKPIVNPSYVIPAGEYAQNIRKSFLDLISVVFTESGRKIFLHESIPFCFRGFLS